MIVVFYPGLGVVLSWNPAVGTLLWVAAGLIGHAGYGCVRSGAERALSGALRPGLLVPVGRYSSRKGVNS